MLSCSWGSARVCRQCAPVYVSRLPCTVQAHSTRHGGRRRRDSSPPPSWRCRHRSGRPHLPQAPAPTTSPSTTRKSASWHSGGGTFDARGFLQKPKRQCPEAEENWRKKLKLLDILNSNPNEVDAALTWVTDRVCGFARKAREGERTTPCWPSTYMTVGKLPKYWRAEYLVAELSSRGFSTERCRSIDQADPEDITRIFDFLHGVHGSTRLPRCCLDKFVCSSVFRERLNDLGRAAAFMAALVRVGRVDWTQMGAYKVVKNSAIQIVIKHCDGDEACGRRGTGDAEHSLEIALWVVNLVAMPQGSCRVCVCVWLGVVLVSFRAPRGPLAQLLLDRGHRGELGE